MPILGLLLLLVEVYFVVHAYKTGRERWIFIILIFSAVGCLAYFILEMLPDMQSSPAARRAKADLEKSLRPGRELKTLQDNLARTDSVANRTALADYYAENGNLTEAIDLYERSLNGNFENDTAILTGLCYACYYNKSFDKFSTYYNQLKDAQGDRLSYEIQLLSARMLEEINDDEAAKQEYASLVKSFPGEEARYRYGMLLKRTGDTSTAHDVFDEIVKESGYAPKYYRKAQKKWIEAARMERKQ